MNPSKEVYYIDGDVKQTMRSEIRKRMEEGDNKILVASYQTYGTGKSIKRLVHIVCAESRKGYSIISQVIGRGMRKIDGVKEEFILHDFADNLDVQPKFMLSDVDGNSRAESKKYKSILQKQSDARIKIYKESKHPYTIHSKTLKPEILSVA